jgi:hypothetical protein
MPGGALTAIVLPGGLLPVNGSVLVTSGTGTLVIWVVEELLSVTVTVLLVVTIAGGLLAAIVTDELLSTTTVDELLSTSIAVDPAGAGVAEGVVTVLESGLVESLMTLLTMPSVTAFVSAVLG